MSIAESRVYAIATLCCVLTLPACGDGDEELDRIEATISNANATIEPVDMDQGLRGSVDLDLTLGPDAEAAGYGISMGPVFLKDPDANRVFKFLETTTDPEGALNINRGSELQFTVNFAAVDNVLEPDDLEDFCQAADDVVLEVSVSSPGADDLDQVSERFILEGCP